MGIPVCIYSMRLGPHPQALTRFARRPSGLPRLRRGLVSSQTNAVAVSSKRPVELGLARGAAGSTRNLVDADRVPVASGRTLDHDSSKLRPENGELSPGHSRGRRLSRRRAAPPHSIERPLRLEAGRVQPGDELLLVIVRIDDDGLVARVVECGRNQGDCSLRVGGRHRTNLVEETAASSETGTESASCRRATHTQAPRCGCVRAAASGCRRRSPRRYPQPPGDRPEAVERPHSRMVGAGTPAGRT